MRLAIISQRQPHPRVFSSLLLLRTAVVALFCCYFISFSFDWSIQTVSLYFKTTKARALTSRIYPRQLRSLHLRPWKAEKAEKGREKEGEFRAKLVPKKRPTL
jgi:hypothetical protein